MAECFKVFDSLVNGDGHTLLATKNKAGTLFLFKKKTDTQFVLFNAI